MKRRWARSTHQCTLDGICGSVGTQASPGRETLCLSRQACGSQERRCHFAFCRHSSRIGLPAGRGTSSLHPVWRRRDHGTRHSAAREGCRTAAVCIQAASCCWHRRWRHHGTHGQSRGGCTAGTSLLESGSGYWGKQTRTSLGRLPGSAPRCDIHMLRMSPFRLQGGRLPLPCNSLAQLLHTGRGTARGMHGRFDPVCACL